MTAIGLSSGTIEYTDTGGDGPVLVLLHGLSTRCWWSGPARTRLAALIRDFISAR